MKQKIGWILSAYILVVVIGLISCNPTIDCGPFPNRFKVKGLDWAIYKATYSSTSPTRLILGYIDNDSVDYNQYAISISPKQETYFAQNHENWGFNLIQTVYACSPLPTTTDEKIDSIVIISNKAFDLSHPPGKDLSDLFDVVVLDHANGIDQEKYSLEDYLATNPSVPNNMTLILKGQPDLTTDSEFLVKYYQEGIDNNDYYDFITSKVVIKR